MLTPIESILRGTVDPSFQTNMLKNKRRYGKKGGEGGLPTDLLFNLRRLVCQGLHRSTFIFDKKKVVPQTTRRNHGTVPVRTAKKSRSVRRVAYVLGRRGGLRERSGKLGIQGSKTKRKSSSASMGWMSLNVDLRTPKRKDRATFTSWKAAVWSADERALINLSSRALKKERTS